MSLHDAVSTVSQPSSIPYQTRSDSSSSLTSSSAGLCSSSLSMFAVGIACGAALGVLLSPRGAFVRSAVRDYASQGSERLQQLASSGMHWAEDTLHQAMRVLEQGRQAFSTSSSSTSSSGSIGSARTSTSGSSSSLTASIGDRLNASGSSVDDFSGI